MNGVTLSIINWNYPPVTSIFEIISILFCKLLSFYYICYLDNNLKTENMKTLFLRLTALIAIVSLSLSCEILKQETATPNTPNTPEEPKDPEEPNDPEVPTTQDITITVKNVTELSYTIDIIPADKEMEYIYLSETGKNLASLGLETPEQIIAYDLQMIIAEAEAFGESVEELMYEYYINVGDITDLTLYGVAPGEEFVVYAYGVEMVDGMPVPTTEFTIVRGTTLESTPIEVAIDATAVVNGTSVDIAVDPLSYAGSYFIFAEPVASIVEMQNPTNEELQRAAMDVWYLNLCTYLRYGFSLEATLQQFTYSGPLTLTENFDANTQYMLAVVPVAENGVVYGYPTIELFTTEEVGKSDNILTISVKDIKPRDVTICVTTTTYDPYLLACFTKEHFASMTDQEIIDYYLTNYGDDFAIYGDLEYPMTGLEPNTEYLIAAFGCEGGVVTTDLFRYEFATPEEVIADIAVSITVVGHYDTKEVAALDSNYADLTSYDTIFSWRVEAEPAAAYYYRAAYKSAQVANVSDEALLASLLSGTPKTSPIVNNFVAYGTEYVCCAVAVDENGNISNLYRTEPISITYENRGNAQDFLDYMNPSQASRASFESLVVEEVVEW